MPDALSTSSAYNMLKCRTYCRLWYLGTIPFEYVLCIKSLGWHIALAIWAPAGITWGCSSLKWIRPILSPGFSFQGQVRYIVIWRLFSEQYSQSCSDCLPHSMGISQAQFQMYLKGIRRVSFMVLTGERAGKHKSRVLQVTKLNSDYLSLRNLSEAHFSCHHKRGQMAGNVKFVHCCASTHGWQKLTCHCIWVYGQFYFKRQTFNENIERISPKLTP